MVVMNKVLSDGACNGYSVGRIVSPTAADKDFLYERSVLCRMEAR
jgi:hypothetical protein